MAETILITRPKPTQIDTLTVDASITEEHSYDVQVTDHAVEEGANVSDHQRPLPERLRLDCLVSNTPISTQAQQRAVSSGNVASNPTGGTPEPQGAAGYVEAAFVKLRALRDAGQLITVVTALRTYESMAIESLRFPRDKTTIDALKFSVSLKRVRMVRNKLTRVVVSRDPRAGGKVKNGSQVTKDTSTADSSALYDLAESGSTVDNGVVSGVFKSVLRR